MLPGFIIDQIRKREEDDRRRDLPVRPQLPIPDQPRPARQKPDDQQDRGVIIIDL